MKAAVQMSTALNGSIGMFTAVLAAIALLGVITQSVARRRKEIGIRIALGARPRQVLYVVLKEGLLMTAVGIALGFAGALIIARVLSTVTAGIGDVLAMSVGDFWVTVGAPILVVTFAAVFCYLPARHSTRIDPVGALREE